MAKPEACAGWTFACGRIIAATRKVEELLKPQVPLGVLSRHGNTAIFDPEHADNDSEVLTHPTAPSAPWRAFCASMTTDTWAQLEDETAKLPDTVAGGEGLKRLQELELETLDLRAKHLNENHPDLADTLHKLGQLNIETGDLKEARQYLEECLQMIRALNGPGERPAIRFVQWIQSWFQPTFDVGATLHALGELSLETGDFKEAKLYLEESLKVKRARYRDGDHPGVTATLNTLGQLSQETGDLEDAKQHLEESLRINRAIHGDTDHPGTAATLQ